MKEIAHTLPKAARLLNAADFAHVFDEQVVRSVDDVFIILASPSQSASPRLGLAIAKRHVKLAVQRNRIKRMVRESWRHNSQDLPPIDIVVMIKSGADKLDNAVLHDKLARHWARLAKRWAANTSKSKSS